MFLDSKLSTEVCEFISHWLANPVLLSQQWRHRRSLVSDWLASTAGEACYHSCNRVREYAARTRGLVHPPPLRFFADSEKTAALCAAGFSDTLWGKPCVTSGEKNWPGQVTELWRHRGTTSGNFTNKSVFYRTLTWRHWCKWSYLNMVRSGHC